MNHQLSESRLANLGAATIHQAFVQYRRDFEAITARACARFESEDWLGLQQDAYERLNLYPRAVTPVVERIEGLLQGRVRDKLIWASMKAVFSGLVSTRHDWELAETFFNSNTRRVFSTVGLDPQIEFVEPEYDGPPVRESESVSTVIARETTTAAVVRTILDGVGLKLPFHDAFADATEAAARIDQSLEAEGKLALFDRVEMIRAEFYRGQRAYLIGRMFSGLEIIPIVFALRNADGRLVLDAVLVTENDISILFSFTRSYFHVTIRRPHDVVEFLNSLMPRKRRAELYNSIGANKHGKTELYRDLLRHIASTNQKFAHAPGVKGLVMAAFAMPDHDLMFKVIRDHFPPQKATTRKKIMEKYRLVFNHDRAGRLVEASEFEHLRFPRHLFEPSLLEELLSETGQSTHLEGDCVVLRHAYIERRVIPMNLYLDRVDRKTAEQVVWDFGNCIKDLAASNIYPGDTLLKNFGVTRHGRVVFYDYDDLMLLTECCFRRLPKPSTLDEELAAEPWYTVMDDDVFPEELRTFLGLQRNLKYSFEQRHADLYDIVFWCDLQQRIRRGNLRHVSAYHSDRRLPRATRFPLDNPWSAAD